MARVPWESGHLLYVQATSFSGVQIHEILALSSEATCCQQCSCDVWGGRS